MNFCIICNTKKDGDYTYLTNKSIVHKSCEQELFKEIFFLEEIINKSKKGFLNNLRNLLFNSVTKEKNELIELKAKQKDIYNYWPTYPPDWNNRKEFLKAERKICNRCNKSKSRKYKKDFLEVHHIIPIHKSGNHLDSNLEVLCKNCHKEEHIRNPHRVRRSKKTV